MRNSLKKITALFMAALMLLAVLAVGALGDEQYSNSVTPGIGLYSILDPETPVVTYIFYNGETEYARQAVKDGETLYEPEAPVMEQDNTVFTGWYREDGTKFAEFGVQTVTAKDTVKLYAHFAPAYYVYFYTPDGSTLKHTMSVSGNSSSIDVSDVTYDAGSTKKVTGWALTPNGTEDISTNVTFPSGANSVSLYAIETEGYWVIFHTGEGSVITPVFKAAGENLLLSDVTEPSRTGFKFSGWYDNAAGTGDVIRQVNSAMNLYAKWDPTTVNYTVIHWWENADDNGYSFHESEQKSGMTGVQTNAAAKNYPGFTVQAIEQTTIKGDGSTIVNVNYKRNIYEVRFYQKDSFLSPWSEITSKRITAKYGANIKASWPGGVWYVNQNHSYGGRSTAQAGLEIMPLDGMKFYGQVEDGNNPAYYYVEVLPGESGTVNYGGKTYKLDHTDYWPNGWTVTKEDRYEIKGFTFYDGTSIGQALKNAKFYYTRNSYDIIFINNGATDKKEDHRYFEQSIVDAYYEPSEPADKPGFIFEGWYDNELGEGNAYTFEGKTMPANNITLYAKWVAPEYTVSFSLGYDNAPTPPENQTVPYKKTAQQPEEPVREGFTFSGWYDQDGKLFNFATQIIRNTNLTARWLSNSTFTVVYNANGGSGTPPFDNTSYADGAGATLQDKGELIAPEGTDKVFLGWATNPQATTADYHPGDNMVIAAANAIDGVITLYAVWGDQPTKTKLTYNANYIAEGASSADNVQHTENGSSELLNNATIALYPDSTFNRPGYQLIGWSKTPGEENEKDYDCGESVIVDNLGEDENILYAVWKRTTVDVIITKQVTGNMGDRSKSFNFTVVSSVAMGSDERYTLSDDAMTATFTLSHDHSMTLKDVPIGATLTVTEEATGYEFSMTFNGTAASNPITVQEGNNEIVVTNNLDAIPDTGVLLDSLPYILILAVVIAIGVIVFIRKRRNRDDD